MKNFIVLVLASMSFLNANIVGAVEEGIKPIQEIFEPQTPSSPEKFVKVAVVQWAPPVAPLNTTLKDAEAFKQINRETIAMQVAEAAAKGAKWVLSSEMSVVGYPSHPELPPADENFLTREEILPYVETIPGPTTKYLGEVAKKHKVYIQVGLAEIDSRTQKLYNVAVLIDPKGKVALKHRKWNLFHVETAYFTPGTEVNVFNSEIGNYAMLVCADVYDSKLLAQYKKSGVKVLGLTTSWAQMNTGMTYFKKAAINTQSYLMAANQPYFPDSGVINPNGSLQSHIRQTDGIAYGYIPLAVKTEQAQ